MTYSAHIYTVANLLLPTQTCYCSSTKSRTLLPWSSPIKSVCGVARVGNVASYGDTDRGVSDVALVLRARRSAPTPPWLALQSAASLGCWVGQDTQHPVHVSGCGG